MKNKTCTHYLSQHISFVDKILTVVSIGLVLLYHFLYYVILRKLVLSYKANTISLRLARLLNLYLYLYKQVSSPVLGFYCPCEKWLLIFYELCRKETLLIIGNFQKWLTTSQEFQTFWWGCKTWWQATTRSWYLHLIHKMVNHNNGKYMKLCFNQFLEVIIA